MRRRREICALCPWRESNPHFVLRTDLFYPLNYKGKSQTGYTLFRGGSTIRFVAKYTYMTYIHPMERMSAEGEKEGIEETRKKVARLVEELHAEGHEFELEETGEHFVVHLADRAIHVPKWEKIGLDLDHDGKIDRFEDIDDYLRLRITSPDGSIAEMLKNPEK